MTGFKDPAPFLWLSDARPAAGLSRLLHESENNKAVYTKFTKGSRKNGSKAQNRGQTKATLIIS